MEQSFEIVPSNIDELWMRLLIIGLLIGMGLLADDRAAKILSTEREKRKIFMATISSSQHVLNNLLNQLQLALFEADRVDGLRDETRKLLEQSIKEGKEQIERLSSVTELDEETIIEAVKPK
jgi:hypothetical protein